MNVEQLESAKKTFFIALGIDVAVTAVALASDFWVIDVLKTVAANGSAASESVIGNIELWRKFSALMILTTCWVGWTLTRWIGACYAYAKEGVRATGFRHEKWITWGWIVPFLNLFKPYQVLSEIYRVGASGYAQSDDWKKESGSGWLLTWWIFWSITHLVMMAALKATIRKQAPDSPTLNQIIGGYNDAILFCAVSLLIAGLWFLVAGNLTKRLVERSNRPFNQVATAKKAVHGAPVSNHAFAEALAEIEEGRLDKGVWARSFSESGGDESKAKALYIKARAESISNAEVWKDTQPPTADSNRAETVQVSRPSGGADSLPKWVSAFIALVLIAGVVGYQQLNNRQTVAVSQVPAPAKRSQIDEFLDGSAKPVQAPAQTEHGPWERYQPQAPTKDQFGGTLVTNPLQAPAPNAQTENKTFTYEDALFEEGLTEYQNKNYAGALARWRPLAEQGYAKAQYQLGWMYNEGEGLQKNEAESINWFRKSAEQGDAYAQDSLGVGYAKGRGVQKNESEAVHWFRKAADQGNDYAQFNLGGMYAKGRGIQQNDVEAVNWYRKAAAQGNSSAQQELQKRGLQ